MHSMSESSLCRSPARLASISCAVYVLCKAVALVSAGVHVQQLTRPFHFPSTADRFAFVAPFNPVKGGKLPGMVMRFRYSLAAVSRIPYQSGSRVLLL